MTTIISFRLSAEYVGDASAGMLLGDFNNWDPNEGVQLQKKEDGSLAAEIALVSGKTYQYRYLLNDGRWVNDFSGTTTWVEVQGHYIENNLIEVPATAAVEPQVAKQPAVKKAAVKKVVANKKPPTTDDLSRIHGITKKVAQLLKKQGVTGFKDLSKLSIKSLKAILEAGGSPYSTYNPSGWPKQAKLAAAGEWEALAALQGTLKQSK